MTAFDSTDIPNAYPASGALSMQDLNGLFRIHLRRGVAALPRICLTEIDQAFVVWGLITLGIFAMAQFSALSWTTQAILDAGLTGTGVAMTSGLTWTLASDEKLRWVIFLWAGLMSSGMVTTAYGIFYGSALVLSHLCILWLGLCAAGYGVMAIGMRSRCFTAACLVHLLAIASLDYPQGWRFLVSGLVIALTLFFFSVVPWDMGTADSDDIPC